MSTAITISMCILMLLAYVFDLTSAKTRIPSVILLLVLGFAVKEAALFLGLELPYLADLLPTLGTIGLILIVLEGSLELQFNRDKLPFIGKSMLVALIPILVLSFGIAYAFYFFSEEANFKHCLANAIPFAVISSAIAIPSARNLSEEKRSFVTYESSFSDIFGVVFFNFITENDHIGTGTWGHFFGQIFLILVISFVATIALAYFLDNIKHHIKFAPIILCILLIYFVSKIYHLPALIFILMFGLFLENIDELRHWKFIQNFHPINFNKEVHKFKELVVEFAFLVRASFFLIFGFLLESSEILDPNSILWAIGIIAGIMLVRWAVLKMFKIDVNPILYIAPRGLITILLFLSIPVSQQIAIAPKSLVIQVVIISALVMMFGIMKVKPQDE